jgi:hypothetical protein
VLALPTLLLGFGGVLSFARSNPAHALHLFVSLALALVVMHVQVVTRFLCASTPAFYWFTAQATRRKDGASYLILLYFSFYVVLGTAMFCNFFPWVGSARAPGADVRRLERGTCRLERETCARS